MESKILSVSLLVTLFSFFISNAAGELVYDINNEPLIASQEYHILPIIRGRGGGLTMRQRNASVWCPLYVAQDELEVNIGLPAKFHPKNPKFAGVTLSADMNINFSAVTICITSNAWQLGAAEGEGNVRYVNTGGSIGNPGPETVNNWFKIEKWEDFDRGYKLVFCPSVCESCEVECGDLGIYNEEGGKRFLGLSGQSFPVMFRKAELDQSQ